MLVLDTEAVPASDRVSMIADSLTGAASATFVTPAGPPERVHLTMHSWDFGSVEVVDARCSAHTLSRTSRQAARDDRPVLAFTCGMRGIGVHSQLDHQLRVRPRNVWATDFSMPYVHHISDTWTTTVKVPANLLGIRADLLGPALAHLTTSPLAPMFFRHVMEVRRVADRVDGAAAVSLGTATLALARALLASVSGDDRLGREALEDVLLLRIRAFVLQHLGEPGLNPATIAAANHISVRQLYKTCAAANIRLEQWIISERLARAADDLARVAPVRIPVSEAARRWGFASPSHFARRFRDAYGMSPREWQALNRSPI